MVEATLTTRPFALDLRMLMLSGCAHDVGIGEFSVLAVDAHLMKVRPPAIWVVRACDAMRGGGRQSSSFPMRNEMLVTWPPWFSVHVVECHEYRSNRSTASWSGALLWRKRSQISSKLSARNMLMTLGRALPEFGFRLALARVGIPGFATSCFRASGVTIQADRLCLEH